MLLHCNDPLEISKRKCNISHTQSFYLSNIIHYSPFFPMAQQPLGDLGLLIFRDFTITLRHTTLGRTPLDE
jgi:hypothetical protein